MRIDLLLLLGAAGLAGCASHPNPAALPMRAPGLVRPPLALAAAAPVAPPAPAVGLPDRIEFPATYRLVQLEGHLVLVRDADAVPLAPTSLRIVAGEVAKGELAYQPALLPQELAAEVAASRARAAELDRALADVMARSRTLSDQALELKAQSQQLAALLAAAAARGPAPAAAPAAAPASD